jgi:hypothetical protein
VSALAHQVAALLAGGWDVAEVRAALADAPGAAEAPDAGAQEKRWRAALKRANSVRRQLGAGAAGSASADAGR